MHFNRGLRCLGIGLWLVNGLLLCITVFRIETERERELPISEAAAVSSSEKGCTTVGVVVGCTTVGEVLFPCEAQALRKGAPRSA